MEVEAREVISRDRRSVSCMIIPKGVEAYRSRDAASQRTRVEGCVCKM